MDILEKMFPGHVARGRAEAEADLAAGVLQQRWSGKLAPSWRDIAQLLQDRYGVGIDIVGHCMTDAPTAARALGYNERMQEGMLARFGSDVVAETCREVERKAKKRRGR
jgi:hypothetical protein